MVARDPSYLVLKAIRRTCFVHAPSAIFAHTGAACKVGNFGCGQSYVPITWGEALVWTVMMVVVASLFLVDSGQYVPYIMSLAVERANFKLQMDTVVVGFLLALKD